MIPTDSNGGGSPREPEENILYIIGDQEPNLQSVKAGEEEPRNLDELPQEEQLNDMLFMKRIELPVRDKIIIEDLKMEDAIESIEQLDIMKQRYAKLQKLYQEIGETNAALIEENSLLKAAGGPDLPKTQQLLQENKDLKQNLESLKTDMEKIADAYQRTVIEKANMEQQLRNEGPNAQVLQLQQEKEDLMQITRDLTRRIQDLHVDNEKLAMIDLKQAEKEFCIKCHSGVLEKLNKDLIEQNENLNNEIRKQQFSLRAINEEKARGFSILVDALGHAQNELRKLKEPKPASVNPQN